MLVIKQFGPVTYAMGTLQEILAGTGIAAKVRALPEDVAGCTLEMGADGLWTGASVGTLTQVEADALVASGALANLATGATYRDTSGIQYTYSAGAGWLGLTVMPTGGDDTLLLNEYLATGGDLKLAFGETYTISAPISIPSDTRFNLNGATIYAESTTHRMIQNSGYATTRNANIEIFGGTLSAGSADGNTHRLVMLKVDGLKIHDMKINSDSGKYAILLADVSEFDIENIHLAVASDGIHVTGPAKSGKISGISGYTGDDFVALGCSDYTSYDVSRGDISVVDISQLHISAGGGNPNGVKLFTVGESGMLDAMRMDAITISNVTGVVGQNGVVIADDFRNNGSFGSITVRNISVVSTQSGYAQVAKNSTTDIDVLDISGITIPKNMALVSCGVIIAGNAAKSISIRNAVDASSAPISNALIRVQGSSATVISSLNLSELSTSGLSGRVIFRQSNGSSISQLSVSDSIFNCGVNLDLASNAGNIDQILLSNIQHVSGDGINVSSLGDKVVFLNGIRQISGTFFVLIYASGSFEIRGAGFVANGTALYRSGSQIIRCYISEFPVHLERLTKSPGCMAYNINGALSCGVGIVVSDGATWKNLVSGLTY